MPVIILKMLFILCIPVAIAAEPDPEPDQSKNEEKTIVVIATRSASDARLNIGNIDKLSAQEIKKVAHAHVQELLTRVPGVNLQRGNGQDYLAAIRSPVLTGAGACGAFLIAEDGISLRAAGFCNVNELFESHTEQASNIEIIRGPGTAFHGSNALHGMINVITPNVPDAERADFSVEAGNYGFSRLKTSVGNHFTNSDSDKHSAYNLALTLSRDDGYRDDSGYDQQKFSGRHLYTQQGLKVSSGVAISNLDQQTAGFILGKNSFKDRELARSNLNPEAFRKAKSLRVWSRFEKQFNDDEKLIITPYIRLTDMTFRQHFLPGKPLEENAQESLGFQSAFYSGSTENLSYSLGFDAEISNGSLKQAQENPTEGSVFLQQTIPVGKHYDYDVKASMIAPFIHLNWIFLPQWQLTAGVRYEHMAYDYNNKMLAGRSRDDGSLCGFGGCRYSRPEDRKDTFNNWSPKLGFSYLLTAGSLLFANFSKGFRAPQATELYRLQRDQVAAELDSVKLNSFELGIRQNKTQLSYELVYFMMDKNNVIFRDSNFFNLSNGKTTHSGIEVRIDYLISDNLNFSVNGSFAKHQYASDQLLGEININGNEIDTAPKHFGSARLEWQATNNIDFELELIHQGDYFLDAENLHRYGGHDLFNLRGNWVLNDNWNVFARVNNLFDKKYADRADYTFFTEERYFPGMPMSLFVGFQWRSEKN